ncbi:EAL domain-containing protein [Azovibrio restrictus]|uniref:EAL domain-containing protein n=1 Tax=Azovibrio restrictus TaxID=146938 RepID=UPI0026EF2E66|nr:EAL domain-containing protein [Azovibrio restrictus]
MPPSSVPGADDLSTRLAAAALEHSMTGQVVFDRELRVKVWNGWMVKTSGISREAALGRRLDEIFPTLQGSYLRSVLEQVVNQGRSFLLSSMLHRELFPFYLPQSGGRREAMRQQICALPLDQGEEGMFGMVQIVDVTQAARREGAMHEAEQRLRTLIDNMPDVVLFKDGEGRWVEANHAAQGVFNLSPGAYRGQTDAEIALRNPALAYLLQRFQQSDEVAWQSRRPHRSDEILHGSDGRELVFDTIKAPIFHPDGSRRGLVIIGRDVTDRKQAERDLALAKQVFEHSAESIVVTDRNNCIISVNPAFVHTTGYAAEEVIGKKPSILRSGAHDEFFYATMWSAILDKGNWSGEIIDRRKDGSTYPKWLSISAVRGKDGEIENFIALFSDISERKAVEQRIRYLAEHDFLTGLPNRVLLTDRVSQAITFARRNHTRLALMFLDLDRFKSINDTLGHNVGDELLRVVTKRLLTHVRASDTVSRLGGDEFVLLLLEVGDEEAVAQVARNLLAALVEPVRVGDHELNVSGSIGIAMYPDHGQDIETLMKSADTAMYQAKAAGRNAFAFFSPEMDVAARSRHEVEAALRHALARKEFILHYQPQADVAGGAVVALEALLRWNRPGFGLVPPDDFIPVAEESGLIVPITEWILDEVCRQLRQWRDSGMVHVPVAINLSPVQFRREGLYEIAMEKVKQYGLTPGDIEFEITENVLMLNTDTVMRTLDRLRAAGFHLIIDDFGTGYSSLSYLKRFPVVKLKIDRSFVRDVSDDPDDAAIAGAIIGMARSLKLGVVAEGVERHEQLDFLRQEKCKSMQGYLLSRPLPADELEEALRSGLRLPGL